MRMSDPDVADVSQKVIISYRLLPNASVESFERWSKEIDQPALLRQPAVRDYQVLRVDPSDDRTQPQFIEVIEATPAELLAWCRDGQVTDGKTLTAALWLQNVLSGAWTLNWQSTQPATPAT